MCYLDSVLVYTAICSHNGSYPSSLSHCMVYWERKVRKIEPTLTYSYTFINSRFLGTKVAALSATVSGYNLLPTIAYQWWMKKIPHSQGNLTVHGWYISSRIKDTILADFVSVFLKSRLTILFLFMAFLSAHLHQQYVTSSVVSC